MEAQGIKIFDLLYDSMKIKCSLVIRDLLFEVVKSGNIDIVKHFLDNKIYELSDADLVQAICYSIESGSEEMIDYFIGQKKDFPLTTDIITSACSANNIKIVKNLIQIANEKRISEAKSKLIMESYKAALSTNNIEILKFLMTNKYEFKELLIKAVEISNFKVIKTILEINHSVEFIN
mgnify:CR=1 FL=1